ncbi:mercury resistance system periplasmic binding protein MerP [Dyella choica]|uniref:Periplasmic mercury ion-binding protein n=1 Tax=Dyella choica TaxID=1927959 RepID=A0A432M802_9GAMM|nr:mercury resistance system periplasmic binding protein MerP [Dyella choica]RUL77672.1 mercury resistance system periplasmic binding protein MerP [Dyella choica]
MKAIATLAAILLGVVPMAGMAATRTVTLAVPGMTCPMCPVTIKKSLQKVAGVEDVSSDLARKTVTISYDDAKTQPAALIQATANAGYPSSVQH